MLRQGCIQDGMKHQLKVSILMASMLKMIAMIEKFEKIEDD